MCGCRKSCRIVVVAPNLLLTRWNEYRRRVSGCPCMVRSWAARGVFSGEDLGAHLDIWGRVACSLSDSLLVREIDDKRIMNKGWAKYVLICLSLRKHAQRESEWEWVIFPCMHVILSLRLFMYACTFDYTIHIDWYMYIVKFREAYVVCNIPSPMTSPSKRRKSLFELIRAMFTRTRPLPQHTRPATRHAYIKLSAVWTRVLRLP